MIESIRNTLQLYLNFNPETLDNLLNSLVVLLILTILRLVLLGMVNRQFRQDTRGLYNWRKAVEYIIVILGVVVALVVPLSVVPEVLVVPVVLVAVTKHATIDQIRELLRLGHADLGENRPVHELHERVDDRLGVHHRPDVIVVEPVQDVCLDHLERLVSEGGRIDRDLEAAVGHGFDHFGEVLGDVAEDRKIGLPGFCEFQAVDLVVRSQHCAAGDGKRCGKQQHLGHFEKFHVVFPPGCTKRILA